MADGLLAALALNLVAEFGDKTQLAVFALSARYRRPYTVFLGAFTGQILATGLAILVGAYAAQSLPFPLLKGLGGLAFLALGLWFLLHKPSPEPTLYANASRASAFLASLGVIFLADMGDKSQAANLLLATRYDAVSVFIGSAISLGVLIAAATFVGHKFAHSPWVPRIRFVAGLLFVALGLAAFVV